MPEPAPVTEAETAPLTLGTAGHIDHGKTVLVHAITGVDTDRLPEERARGISIELGFAPLELPSGLRLSVVDVPGHERFVRTMVAGASGIDRFLLVVAADDGVMPQTREHLAVLQMLRVPAGVVALTKVDLVDDDGAELAEAEVRELLAGGPLADTPIVRVCAPKRAGLETLLEELDRVASARVERDDGDGEARLHVDRSFTLHGIGTVVTGTLWGGSFSRGQTVRIAPAGLTGRVRGVEVHGQERERARPGERVALNLSSVEWSEVRRGDVVTASESTLRPSHLLDAAIELLPEARPLERGARVHVHHGTRDTPARLAPLEADALRPGTRAFAQLRLERPVVAAPGDRFVVRQVAPPDTIGGGVVLDPRPRKHGAGAEQVERLRLLDGAGPLARVEARLAGSPSGLGPREADPILLARLEERGRAVRTGSEPRWFAPRRLAEATERLLAALAEDPARPSSRGALAAAAGVSDVAAKAVLEELLAEGRAIARGPGFVAAGTGGREDERVERALELLAGDRIEPRSVQAIADALGCAPSDARAVLDGLVFEGRLARLKPGLYFHPGALQEAEVVVTALCERDGSVTIAGLRDELGASRKYAQALLEHFDARRLTRRQGDEHVLRRPGPDRAPT